MAFSLTVTTFLVGWEDHPDIEDHRETDRLYRLACEQTGYDEYELLDKEHKEELKNYKRSKFFKEKNVEDSN